MIECYKICKFNGIKKKSYLGGEFGWSNRKV